MCLASKPMHMRMTEDDSGSFIMDSSVRVLLHAQTTAAWRIAGPGILHCLVSLRFQVRHVLSVNLTGGVSICVVQSGLLVWRLKKLLLSPLVHAFRTCNSLSYVA